MVPLTSSFHMGGKKVRVTQTHYLMKSAAQIDYIVLALMLKGEARATMLKLLKKDESAFQS